MLRWRRVIAGCVIVISAAALLGCAVIDQYSGRAVSYNVEAEQAHDQALLLNIVRASQRRPRQFTIVQKITGQAQAQGTANVTVPMGPHSNLQYKTGQFSTQLSGTETFEVASLETNDWYEGILRPLSGQFIHLYIQAEFPHDLLWNLFLGKIVIRRTDKACALSHELRCEMTFQNYAGTDLELGLFQTMVGYLINLGLNTQTMDPPVQAQAKAAAKGDTKSKDDNPPQPWIGYCFSTHLPRYAGLVDRPLTCGYPSISATFKRSTRIDSTTTLRGITMSSEVVAVMERIVEQQQGRSEFFQARAKAFSDIRQFAGKHVSVALFTRSTETLIYYVGEVVRRQLYPDLDEPAMVMTKLGPPLTEFPIEPCTVKRNFGKLWQCQNLFAVERGPPIGLGGGVSVDYEGQRYSIPASANAGATYDTPAGASYTVLTIVRQMLTLNTSAKSLPASSLLVSTSSP